MPKDTLKVSILQMQSSWSREENICSIKQAAKNAKDCDLLALPEMAGLMNQNRQKLQKILKSTDEEPFILECQSLAKKYSIWIHSGSCPVVECGRFLNRTVVINPLGKIACTYDKIHLFDVNLSRKINFKESAFYSPGRTGSVVITPWGKWGMTICYDVRFPTLFSTYSRENVSIIFVPSAFTVETGKAHWEVLLKARAIENSAWIIAPAQVGCHKDGRKTYGHSLVVNPNGEVVLNLGAEKCQINYEINFKKFAKTEATYLVD